MKISALNTAIRGLRGAPKVRFKIAAIHPTHAGQEMVLELQKTPLLAELKRMFPNGRSEETGITVDDDGFLMIGQESVQSYAGGGAPSAVDEDDLL